MIRFRVWRDDEHRRFIPTGDGTLVVEKGETCVVLVGKTLDKRLLDALNVSIESGPLEVIK
jgi:hypothetical protein